jgi:hypothetical protein
MASRLDTPCSFNLTCPRKIPVPGGPKTGSASGPLGEFSSGPNKGCPTPILPLTSSEMQVTTAINTYDKVDGGGTVISEGVAWGMRVLSPGEPFTQTKPGESTKRVMVVMSDGENQASINPHAPNPTSGADYRGSPAVTDYTAYGYVRFGRLSPDERISTFESALTEKTREACDSAKAQGIEVYTVLFNSTNTAAREALRNCATVPEMFYNARDAEELENTFRAIASDFGAYRLVK